jgi:hypothetical protein
MTLLINKFSILMNMQLYFSSYFCSIDGTFSEQIGRFANDGICEEKNAMAKTVLLSNEPRLALFATRNIFPGEEIRFDYGINDLPWRKKSQQVILH